MDYDLQFEYADDEGWRMSCAEPDAYDEGQVFHSCAIADAIDKLVDAVNKARVWNATMDLQVECEPDDVINRIRGELKEHPINYDEDAELAAWNEAAAGGDQS